ncbi:MAG: hypothetical protein JXB88_02595 [Spirochaetales bacterium]|nr:hypothetical protein [Spirochaetales bacterium]
MKYILVTGILFLLLPGCAVKNDPSTVLVNHLKQMERIFERNKKDTAKLSEELSAYANTNMESMQEGVKALYKKMEKAKENPLESFDLLAKVTEIYVIIVKIQKEYGDLLNDPEVEKVFTEYKKVFTSMENIGQKQ